MKDLEINETCKYCGLPRESCLCDNLFTGEQEITIYNDRRKWGKVVTIISFEENPNVDLNDLLKKAKKKVASGGVVRGNEVELQGEHRFSSRYLLIV